MDGLIRIGHEQRLMVGVDSDEFNTANTGFDHAVDRVGATAADADDFDYCQII